MKRTQDSLTRKNSIRWNGFDYTAQVSYFVTIVVKDRRKIFDEERIARATVKVLLELRESYRFNLYQFCLMPDHFHAVIGVGNSGLSLGRICGDFKSLSTREYWKYHRGKLWQRQFYDHVIRNEEDFHECIDYICENPVKAGLVDHWMSWKYQGSPDLRKY